MSEGCIPHHDWFNALLTFGLCFGLVISYLPQHFRIIHAKSSEGLSPVFLLLGTTSAASGMFNMITLQAPIVRCCRVVSLGSCVEMTAGVVQIGLQWLCFGLVFVLYMIYYPKHLKYVEIDLEQIPLLPPIHVKTPVRSNEWRISIIVAWIATAHFAFVSITTTYFLTTSPASPPGRPYPTVAAWATFLGISSAILAAVQYAPQLFYTYHMKLVGALSIPMMMIQTPGGILMVTSIVLRPGTNWTSWISFAAAAILQGCLLTMCIFWKIRQRKLNIDDFGNPLGGGPPSSASDLDETPAIPDRHYILLDAQVTTPGSLENPNIVHLALANALESASENNLPSPPLNRLELELDEEAPLLCQREINPDRTCTGKQGWSAWFGL